MFYLSTHKSIIIGECEYLNDRNYSDKSVTLYLFIYCQAVDWNLFIIRWAKAAHCAVVRRNGCTALISKLAAWLPMCQSLLFSMRCAIWTCIQFNNSNKIPLPRFHGTFSNSSWNTSYLWLLLICAHYHCAILCCATKKKFSKFTNVLSVWHCLMAFDFGLAKTSNEHRH